MSDLITYIQSLSFAYLKTYSGLSIKQWARFREEQQELEKDIKKQLRQATPEQSRNLHASLRSLQSESRISLVRLLDLSEKIHPLAKQVSRLDQEKSKDLLRILQHEVKLEARARCVPIFRDAIAFFAEDDTIVAILHICFSCSSIEDHQRQRFRFDIDAYELLRYYLISLGHQIQA